MTDLYTCPNCKQNFSEVIEDTDEKFCPHCDIQLFVKGDCNDKEKFWQWQSVSDDFMIEREQPLPQNRQSWCD